MKFHWMKIISLAAIAMVRGQNNEISFFDERERERGGGRRDCPTFVENICIFLDLLAASCVGSVVQFIIVHHHHREYLSFILEFTR